MLSRELEAKIRKLRGEPPLDLSHSFFAGAFGGGMGAVLPKFFTYPFEMVSPRVYASGVAPSIGANWAGIRYIVANNSLHALWTAFPQPLALSCFSSGLFFGLFNCLLPKVSDPRLLPSSLPIDRTPFLAAFLAGGISTFILTPYSNATLLLSQLAASPTRSLAIMYHTPYRLLIDNPRAVWWRGACVGVAAGGIRSCLLLGFVGQPSVQELRRLVGVKVFGTPAVPYRDVTTATNYTLAPAAPSAKLSKQSTHGLVYPPVSRVLFEGVVTLPAAIAAAAFAHFAALPFDTLRRAVLTTPAALEDVAAQSDSLGRHHNRLRELSQQPARHPFGSEAPYAPPRTNVIPPPPVAQAPGPVASTPAGIGPGHQKIIGASRIASALIKQRGLVAGLFPTPTYMVCCRAAFFGGAAALYFPIREAYTYERVVAKIQHIVL